MRFFLPLLLALTGLSDIAVAQDVIPERRLVVTTDVDFYGSDLQSMFDTDLESCQNACLADPQCRAFTFNKRSNACFPKSEISERNPYDGAVSGEVLTVDPRIARDAPARAQELAFLQERDLARAVEQAIGIGPLHPGGQWDVETLLKSADDRRRAGDPLNAMRWIGAAVAVSDASDQWVEYGRLSLAIDSSNAGDMRQHAERAFLATVNGYLRAGTDAERVNALSVMSEALERLGRGRDMIPALRLAKATSAREDLLAALDDAIAKHGFRITDHVVESDQADPRICAEFSEPLTRLGADYAPFVRLPDQRMAVEAEGSRICVSGLAHGQRYTLVFREGLPAESGEILAEATELSFYVRDRSPSVRFPGRAYVLPRAGDAAVPVETVNLDTVDLRLRHVSDRSVLRAIQEQYFGRPLPHFADRRFAGEIGDEVWTGVGEVGNDLNADVLTRLPVGEIIEGLPAGVYALSASVPGEDRYDDPGATQWFVLSDLGIATMSGDDGLHVFVRGLGDAELRKGVEVTLVSRANRVLAETRTDTQGHARFEPGLTRGQGGSEPALVTARDGEADMAFLSLSDPAFDLSDRGVEGRAPGGPVDVFLATDRGAYRAGEVIHATVLARDSEVAAIEQLPLTAILTRPDGVEYARHVSQTGLAGGHVFEMPIGTSVPRGVWRLEVKADMAKDALASQTILIEDFLPERIDFEMSLPDGGLRPGRNTTLDVAARYLYGAPGADLLLEGDTVLRTRRSLDSMPGYVFGRHDREAPARRGSFQGERTDAEGNARVQIGLPDAPADDRMLELDVVGRVSEGSSRPVERRVTQAVEPAGPVIGLRPLFDEGVVAEGTEAAFDVIALSPALKRVPMQVRWTVNRVETRYQWYQEYGNWNWEPVTTRQAVKRGEAALSAEPVQVSAPVEWGHYELVVERIDGGYVSSSQDFHAGWYAPADVTRTPDMLELSLDKPGYRSGDVATLRLVPRYAGKALVTVMSNHLIAMKTVDVKEGENRVSLDVTDDWGAGAYVSATVIRPMDVAAAQNPARSMGLSYAQIDPDEKQLSVEIDAPDTSQPREPLDAVIRVDGGEEDEMAYVTVAAVDVGILNLTGFESPDPSDHYFGQQRLGMDIRDVYGRLIDGMNGVMGAVRSGGDASDEMRMQSPPPTDELVAFFSGPVEVGPDGTADVSFDMPEFNGTVRLMAVAWTRTGVGQGAAEVLVRDPVVVTASLPRFMAPGDESRLLLELAHADGPAGRMGLDVSAEGVTLDAAIPSGVTLADGEKASFSIPVVADAAGDHRLRVALTTPDGRQLVKALALPVRVNDPEIALTRRFVLGSGETFTLDENVFAGMRSGTASATVSAGPLAKLNAPGLLSALDRYPYGCSEQVASAAMPLLYFGKVATALGHADQRQVQERIDQSIARVLSHQSSNGAFGLWRAASGDFWLDAYVSDFLSRARVEGHDVPQAAFRMAMDNLRNRVNYAPDFDEGGADIAYALMVLAREGAAAMADLRYFADVKVEAFSTPLAVAQLGAALAMYGDQTRADALFARAGRMMQSRLQDEAAVWRADYGSNLRDAAGVLGLAIEAGSEAVDRRQLADHVAQTSRSFSTQESAWSLLAAKALVDDPSVSGLSVNGSPLDDPFVRMIEAEARAQPQAIRNESDTPTDLTLTTFGVPEVAPEAGGYGYRIERDYYTMEGEPVQDLTARMGERFVAVLRITPFERGEARLMIDDSLPAGFEIDNPNLLRSGDIRALDWLDPQEAEHAEFRSDRFLAAVDWRSDKAFQLAYIVRAVSPGEFHHPAAQVEDMYRPHYRAQTAAGRLIVSE
ncbi:alpha-2-macroglobulin family protein [Aquicoccus sp.]|uniref:alpha-2-macroglobulin family protein n=1 Tax=Aquicoccus sp. TaxID=2055851 RepID=UPI00356A093B